MTYDNMIELRSRLLAINAGTVLDVACGKGDFLKFALRSFNSYRMAVGIDTDVESLNQARQNLYEYPVSFVVGSALNMPFLTESFSMVTISNSLHHIEDHKKLFEELGRICRNDGSILINEMTVDKLSEYQESYSVYHHFIAELDNLLGFYHRDAYAEKELHQIVKESGLKVVDFFMHEDRSQDYTNAQEIGKMTDRMFKKLTLLKTSDSYYFYLNKARDIEKRIKKTGIHRPDHAAFILRPWQ